MNKSPPTAGGLFYFGQIAIFKDKPGIRSRNMQKVKGVSGSLGSGIRKERFVESPRNHGETATWLKEKQALADHPDRWQKMSIQLSERRLSARKVNEMGTTTFTDRNIGVPDSKEQLSFAGANQC